MKKNLFLYKQNLNEKLLINQKMKSNRVVDAELSLKLINLRF